MDIQASQYHDLKGLSELRSRAGSDADVALKPVAQQFESLFLHMMLKSMRDTVPESGLLDNQATGFYQDMLDSQLSVTLAERGGIGLAETLTEQLRQQGGATVEEASVSASAQALRNSLLENRVKDFQTPADNY